MNRYPLWKYLLIVAAVAIGLLYTLPNFYGEVPAVQVSPLRSNLKADAALMARVEVTVKKAELAVQGIALDATSVKVRLSSAEDQLKAKDALQAALGEDYVVALNLLSRSPRWMASIGALPMYLGLDLRGGVHFLMQVDMKSVLTKNADNLANTIRTNLRDQRIQYAGVLRDGQVIIARFRDAAARDKALILIPKERSDLSLRSFEAEGEFRIEVRLSKEAIVASQKAALEQNITTLRNRVNELGVAEPIIQQQGADRVVVQLPGVQDTARAKDLLGRTATLEFRMVEAQSSNSNGRDFDPTRVQAAVNGNPPLGTELIYDKSGPETEPLVLSKQVVITGDRLIKADPTTDQQAGRPVVSITLDSQGARVMRDVTRQGLGRRMAVLLIEKGKPDVLTAPVIQGEFSSNFQISGRFTSQEATDLAILLRSGALAAPMDIIEERTVGPSLGAENIKIGFQSMWMGFAAIAVFMIAYYALLGLISVIALGANLLFLIALLSMLQATLTLPGIAAIALALGMAIDANVLINERIREELRNGNTPHAALHAGYERAWATILDSNATTLIAGIALFAFGSGPVRGFAVVHCLGIMTSMFSAVLVSRAIVNLYYGGRRKLDKISIGQVWKPASTQAASPVASPHAASQQD